MLARRRDACSLERAVKRAEGGADRDQGGFLSTCGLSVRLHNPSLLPELIRHFERSGFSVQRRGDTLRVQRPDAPSEDQAQREIQLHLDVWLLMYPDSLAAQH